jgi:thiol-disulfide isomerase/thioredoxin
MSTKISLLCVLTVLAVLSCWRVYADKTPTLLMFTASWCASCRDVLPSVKAYAASKGYPVQVIDVDDANAQGISRQLGLTINQVSPPMVFLTGVGHPQIIINDASADQAEAMLKQKVR